MIIEIYPINIEYKNNKNEIITKEQNIILIGEKNMITYLNENKAKLYGLDFTFHIIPNSFKKYKLMTLYAIEPTKHYTIISCLILLKFTDTNSLIKIFSILNAIYNFNPYCVTTDFNLSQLKALKTCPNSKHKPYIVTCLFHLGQAILKKMKTLNLLNKKLTKRDIEILRNLEILCFVDYNNIEKHFNYLKNEVFINEGETELMNYFEKTFIKRYKKLFNYSHLIKDIYKLKNLFIKNKGSGNTEKELISKLKSLELVYFTNNICESIHGKIAKYINDNKVTKQKFKDCLNYIIKEYSNNNNENIRKDYIIRTLIVIIEKHDLNKDPKFIDYNTYKKELNYTVSIMTGNVKINIIEEIINT